MLLRSEVGKIPEKSKNKDAGLGHEARKETDGLPAPSVRALFKSGSDMLCCAGARAVASSWRSKKRKVEDDFGFFLTPFVIGLQFP
jgi:hypothetical protein